MSKYIQNFEINTTFKLTKVYTTHTRDENMFITDLSITLIHFKKLAKLNFKSFHTKLNSF